MLKILLVTYLLLFLGDLLSTFFYHIPEHVFGSLHLKTHHSSQKTFFHYAVLSTNILVMLDGILGALPYLPVAVILWKVSSIGVICGLILGQFHVWWRHTSALGWKTPKEIITFCQILGITTPERHWLHHHKSTQAYGDIFTFFDQPAKVWWRWLRFLKLGFKKAMKTQ